ncbi:hypothetical protein EDM56_13900 [Brevibacillus fluminis]|uniref:Uncharacterized protein n=1 Tax=Brevibacillus fluminis TaxID=511487 RepID=A0A3M8DI23_9BACL|nr:hypothetical protein [Brevibacillus fluminis]RNB87666.1 hypothetical protein EDM56_13900 [Brevibacillus fluminis]
MKKFTATSILALTLLLGVSSSAFAATYSDVEPNNTVATASHFAAADGNQITGDLNGSDPQDYYTFTAQKTQKMRFQISYSKAGGQFLRLKVGTSVTSETIDYVDVNLVAGTTYTIRIDPFVTNTSVGSSYNVYTYALTN